MDVVLDLTKPENNEWLRYDGNNVWEYKIPPNLSNIKELNIREFKSSKLPGKTSFKNYELKMYLKGTKELKTFKYTCPEIDPSINMKQTLTYDRTTSTSEPFFTFKFTAQSLNEAKEIATDKMNFVLNHSLYTINETPGTFSSWIYIYKKLDTTQHLKLTNRAPTIMNNSPVITFYISNSGRNNRASTALRSSHMRMWRISVYNSLPQPKTINGVQYYPFTGWCNSAGSLVIGLYAPGTSIDNLDFTTTKRGIHILQTIGANTASSPILYPAYTIVPPKANNSVDTQAPDKFETMAACLGVLYKNSCYCVYWDNNELRMLYASTDGNSITTSLQSLGYYMIHVLGFAWSEILNKYIILAVGTTSADSEDVDILLFTDNEGHVDLTLYLVSSSSITPSEDIKEAIISAQYGSETFELVERNLENGHILLWFVGSFSCEITDSDIINLSPFLWCHYYLEGYKLMRCLHNGQKWYMKISDEELRTLTPPTSGYIEKSDSDLEGYFNFASGSYWSSIGIYHYYFDDAKTFYTTAGLDNFNLSRNKPFSSALTYPIENDGLIGGYSYSDKTAIKYTSTGTDGSNMSAFVEACDEYPFLFPSLVNPEDINLNPYFKLGVSDCIIPCIPLFSYNKVKNDVGKNFYSGVPENLYFTFKLTDSDGFETYPILERLNPSYEEQEYSIYPLKCNLATSGSLVEPQENPDALVLSIDEFGFGSDGVVFIDSGESKIKFKTIKWSYTKNTLRLRLNYSLEEIKKYFGKVIVSFKFTM